MKKVLGTSFIALFALVPFAANAEAGDRTIRLINATPPMFPSPQLATVTYVQGAYVAAADKIDALILDTAAVDGKYVKEIKTVSANLGALDSQVGINANDIEILKGGDDVPGSVDNKIKTAVQSVDAGALNQNISSNTQAIEDIKAKKIKYVETWPDGETQTVSISQLD